MHGTLVFDGNCGFCTRSANLVQRLDRHDRVRTVPFQQAGFLAAVGLTDRQAADSIWWLGADGSRHSGAHAANAVLAAALGTALPLRIYRLPWVRALQERLYRWVAANRYRLPGTTPWCVTHDC